MTTAAELVKARLGANLNDSAAAAMATDAGISTGAIGKVVMTLNAVHRAVAVVWKAHEQGLTSVQHRFAQGARSTSRQQCQQRRERTQDYGKHEPGMTPEHQSALER